VGFIVSVLSKLEYFTIVVLLAEPQWLLQAAYGAHILGLADR
jgi:hypothetical protein